MDSQLIQRIVRNLQKAQEQHPEIEEPCLIGRGYDWSIIQHPIEGLEFDNKPNPEFFR